MDKLDIVGIILGSSLLTGIATSVIQVRLFHLGYRNEYYKQIVSKRLDAYTRIETLLKYIGGDSLLNGVRVPMFFTTEKHINELLKEIALAISSSVWIADETTLLLEELNGQIIKVMEKNGLLGDPLTEPETERNLHRAGIEIQPYLATMRVKLRKRVRVDIVKLHDLKFDN